MRWIPGGSALIAGLAFACAFVALASPATAGAAELAPCAAPPPTGPIVETDGEGTLTTARATRKALRRSGVRQGLVRPASAALGRPTFPVGSVAYAATSRIGLKGGIRLKRGRRSVAAGKLTVAVPTAARKALVLKARLGGAIRPLFRVKGGKRKLNLEGGELTARGTARLTPAAARVINRKLGLKRKRKLRAGLSFGRFDLYSSHIVTDVDDPVAEVPEEPPVKERPEGAATVLGATTIKWHVRDSWIDYVATGEGTSVSGGASADPPSGSKHLSYSFNFPFASGWSADAGSLIKGSGTVGFRFCEHTINFTVSDPEIELGDDATSRIIFRVNGTDGTAFPDRRAIMVKLMPGRAAGHTETDNGDGTRTIAYDRIPGYIPAEGTGLFAGFYPSYDPSFGGGDQASRPDRFGYLSLTYTVPDSP